MLTLSQWVLILCLPSDCNLQPLVVPAHTLSSNSSVMRTAVRGSLKAVRIRWHPIACFCHLCTCRNSSCQKAYQFLKIFFSFYFIYFFKGSFCKLLQWMKPPAAVKEPCILLSWIHNVSPRGKRKNTRSPSMPRAEPRMGGPSSPRCPAFPAAHASF